MRFFSNFAGTLCLIALLAGCSENKTTETTQQESVAPSETATAARGEPTILFFGNSLTAGYGVEPSEAFPALVQDKLDSLGLSYKVVNAGVSGETTSGGNSRIDWVLRQPVDVFVLELGGNDGLRGIPLTETRQNLQAIMDKVKAKYPAAKIILAGMQIPPSMGRTYATEFRDLYTELAEENDVTLIPFLLEGVGGIRDLNQADGIHPTPEGHRIVAGNVWEVLANEL
ncbi:arylesterase [Persicitalea sp.]|uniref:arylesterase n=1 Tax=Persicitalea sp. TaxID=3100273 RepID=UPI0035942761